MAIEISNKDQQSFHEIFQSQAEIKSESIDESSASFQSSNLNESQHSDSFGNSSLVNLGHKITKTPICRVLAYII